MASVTRSPHYVTVRYGDNSMTQAQFEDSATVSARLRELRENRRITTQIMSDATGIPKRTLESYMLRKNAALPGLEALKRLSVGLGVSLDWLVFRKRQVSPVG